MTAEQISPNEDPQRRHQRHMENILELRSFLLAPVSQPKWKMSGGPATGHAKTTPAARRERRPKSSEIPKY